MSNVTNNPAMDAIHSISDEMFDYEDEDSDNLNVKIDSNVTSKDEFPSIWTPRIVTLSTLSALIVIGNLIVIIAIMCHRHLRRNIANYFICSLALSDLLVGLTVYPLGILHETIYDNLDPKPTIFCDILQASQLITIFSSLWQMTVIALDRYLRLTSPLEYKRRMTRRNAIILILSIYLATFLAEGVYLLDRYILGAKFGSKCMYFELSSLFSMLFFYVIGMVPSSYMIYLYYHLYKLASRGCKLRKRMRKQIADQNKEKIKNGSKRCEKESKEEMKSFIRRPPGEASLTAKVDGSKIEEEKGKAQKEGSFCKNNPRSSRTSRKSLKRSLFDTKGQKKVSNSDEASDGPGSSMIGTRINNVAIIKAGKKLYLRPSLVQYQAAILVGVLIGVYFFFITPCYAVYAYWFYCKECVEQSWIYYLYPWTGLINSALNPVLYFSLSKDFRKVLHPIKNKMIKAYNYLIELEYVTTT